MIDDMPQEERRTSWRELHDLFVSMQHEFDKRISIVEVRMSGQDDRLESIETDLRDTKQGVQKVLEVLSDHTDQENKDRQRLLIGMIATLLSVLGFAGAVLINHLLR